MGLLILQQYKILIQFFLQKRKSYRNKGFIEGAHCGYNFEYVFCIFLLDVYVAICRFFIQNFQICQNKHMRNCFYYLRNLDINFEPNRGFDLIRSMAHLYFTEVLISLYQYIIFSEKPSKFLLILYPHFISMNSYYIKPYTYVCIHIPNRIYG